MPLIELEGGFVQEECEVCHKYFLSANDAEVCSECLGG